MEQKYRQYCCEYDHEGRPQAIEIYATSWEDAEQRLKAIGFGKVVGTLEGVYPVGMGWLVRLRCWWSNRMRPKGDS